MLQSQNGCAVDTHSVQQWNTTPVDRILVKWNTFLPPSANSASNRKRYKVKGRGLTIMWLNFYSFFPNFDSIMSSPWESYSASRIRYSLNRIVRISVGRLGTPNLEFLRIPLYCIIKTFYKHFFGETGTVCKLPVKLL